MQSFAGDFATLEPQLLHWSKSVTDDLRGIGSKENEFGVRFRSQLDGYKKVKGVSQFVACAQCDHFVGTGIN
jgi:hypothetical protein